MALPISHRRALQDWQLYLFVVPSALLVLTFALYPAVSAIYHSFFVWHGGPTQEFAGLKNFRAAFQDGTLWHSFGTVGVLVAANIVKLIPSILLAVLIHRLKHERYRNVYRVILVVPLLVPGLVTLLVWKSFFDPHFGLLNAMLEGTHLKGLLVALDAHVFHWGVFQAAVPVGWLSEPMLILPALILWGFPWISAITVLICLAGLRAVGPEIYEAAVLDGAGGWQLFRHIELPLLTTQVRLTLLLLIIGTFQSFGLQFLLLGPGGGPEARGMTPGLWMYNRAFVAGEFGYACAIGVILFGCVSLLAILDHKYVRVAR